MEVDAVQQVEVRLDRIGLVHQGVLGRIGHAQGQAMRLPVGLDRVGLALIAPATAAQAGQARVGDEALGNIHAPGDEDRVRDGHDLDLGAQLVEAQPLDQGVAPLGRDVQHDAVLLAPDEQVEQQPSRRRQQGAEAKLARLQGLHVLGQQIVQEGAGVGAADADQGATIKTGDGHKAKIGRRGVVLQPGRPP